MKVSVSSNALCFVLGWIEGLPLFKLTGLLPPVEISKCLTRIKNDMSEAEFVASKDEELRRQDSAMAQMDKDARSMLSENMILRKELADIKLAKGKLECENLTLRFCDGELREKLKEAQARLDKLRIEPVQVGQQEKWTARVRDILDRVIAYTETSGYDRGMPLVAELAREAKMLMAGVPEKGSEKNNDIRPNRTIRLLVEAIHDPAVFGSNGRAKLGYTVVATKRSTMPIEQWTTEDPTQRIRELPPMPSLAHLSHTLMEYTPLDLRHSLDVNRGLRAVLKACGMEVSE